MDVPVLCRFTADGIHQRVGIAVVINTIIEKSGRVKTTFSTRALGATGSNTPRQFPWPAPGY